MGRGGEPTTLADVRVGASAVLAPGPALDARHARRLVELGLRPGATVRVIMRTAGGGRVLGVDNLRIVVDRTTVGSIPVTVQPRPDPAPIPARDRRRRDGRLRLLARSTGLTVLPGNVPANRPASTPGDGPAE
jgi:ferrous iron transport protein A